MNSYVDFCENLRCNVVKKYGAQQVLYARDRHSECMFHQINHSPVHYVYFFLHSPSSPSHTLFLSPSLSLSSLVNVEHNLQELCDEFQVVWKSLLKEDHHASDKERDLPQRGEGVERCLESRPHPLINYPCQCLENLHILRQRERERERSFILFWLLINVGCSVCALSTLSCRGFESHPGQSAFQIFVLYIH